ncbi:MAG TPA: hypothetical protein VIM11_19635 [Tepidisphaeraceae bacterium]
MKAQVTVFCVFVLFASSTFGQVHTDAIREFVNDSTIGIGRVDLSKVDFNALDRWADELIGQSIPVNERAESLKQVHDAIGAAHQWTDQFTKAGGKTAWVLFSPEQGHGTPYFVVPIEAGANAESLKKLLSINPNIPPAQVGTNLLLADNSMAINALKKMQSTARPEFEKAFASSDATGDVVIAVAPSADSKKVIESMIPRLPNGQPSAPLTRDLSWISLSVKAPPTPPAPPTAGGHILIQASDEAAAQNLRNAMLGLFPKKTADEAKSSPLTALLATVGELVQKSQVQKDRVVIDLQGDLTNQLAARVTDGVRLARENARRMQAMNQIKQLLLVCIVWANGNKESQFPASMEEAIKAAKVPDQLLANPRQPADKTGYNYVRPSDGIKADFQRLVIYEKFTQWDGGICVGFADGHVEFISDQARFQQLLDVAQKKQLPAGK